MISPQLVMQMEQLIRDAGLSLALDAFLLVERRRWEAFESTVEDRQAWRSRAFATISDAWNEV